MLNIEPGKVTTIVQHLRAQSFWTEIIPGLDSVAASFHPLRQSEHDAARLMSQAIDCITGPVPTAKQTGRYVEPVEISVAYGGAAGPDFEYVCQRVGKSPGHFIADHCAAPCSVAMMGFTPGFAYISMPEVGSGLQRLSTPRKRVAAGSIGLIDGYCGLYALEGPGGWPIIGRTTSQLFDAEASEPFRLAMGMRVKFTAIDTCQ